MAGPSGLGREAFRTDMRKIVAAFKDSKGQYESIKLDKKKLSKAMSSDDRKLTYPGEYFLWIANVNKYFAAIVVPRPTEGKEYCDWIINKTGRLHNPDGDEKIDSGDEMLGLDITAATRNLAPTGQANSSETYNFQLYLNHSN